MHLNHLHILVLQSAISICLAAQCVLAQYQSAPAYGNGYQQQRKMAPTPQTYGQQQQSSYGGAEQYREPAYKQAAPQYEERAPAASYSKPAPASSYGRQQSSGYGAQAQAQAYAKPAPKYEEPYVSI